MKKKTKYAKFYIVWYIYKLKTKIRAPPALRISPNMHPIHGEILEIIAEEGVQAGVVSNSGDLNLQDPSRTGEITELGAEIIP